MVEQDGGTVEQCGRTVWWNSETVEQCGGTMEQWNSVEQYGAIWWNSGTVWRSVVEQCKSAEQSGGTLWWKSVVEQWNSVVDQ